MKVKELRSWLSDIGEKQKHHRVRSQGSSLASTDKLSIQPFSTIERKGSNAETSPTSSREDASPRNYIDELEAGFSPLSCKAELIPGRDRTSATLMDGEVCAKCGAENGGSRPNLTVYDCFVEASLSLKQNPSADPTVATRDDSTAAANDIPQQTASWDTTLVSGGSWDSVGFPDPEPAFYFSPSTSFDESIESNSGGTGSYEPSGPTRGRPADYYITEKFEGGIEGLADMGQVHLSLLQKQAPILANAERTEQHDESSNESSTIDSMPRTMHSANIFGNKTLTAGTLDFICSDGKIKRSHRSLPDCFADDETGSSLSNDSSSKPSIIPGALDSKMAQLLLDPYPINEAIRREAGYKRASYSIPRCKKIDPKDLEFLHRRNSSSVAETEIYAKGRRSGVSRGIQKFGGTKKTIVERRKEELEKLWAESKAAVHVKKVKWGVCKKTGMYKKKVVIDVQKK
jgi:ribosomal protein L32